MGSTLFRYIFRDLLRVFVLTTVTLAGVLSFAGLLKPLGEQGLGTVQAVTVLAWLMPAMLVYSLPVAALFATSFVYGRMAADNEATAAKAAGVAVSPFGLLLPALVLGGLLGLTTVSLLTTVVPFANLKVEQTVWGNLAQLVSSQINRTSRATFTGQGGRVTVFARRAILPSDEEIAQIVSRARDEGRLTAFASDNVQVVRLEDAAVVRYRGGEREETLPRVPEEYYAAASATIFIEPPGYGRDGFEQSALTRSEFIISVVLADGAKFPPTIGTKTDGDGPAPMIAAASSAQFGPIRREVPLRTNPKFMAVGELRGLLVEPERASRISRILDGQARLDQQVVYLRRLSERAVGGGITLAPDVPDADDADTAQGDRRDYRFSADAPGRIVDHKALVFDGIPVRLRQITRTAEGGTETLLIESTQARVEVEPLGGSGDAGEMLVTFTFADAAVAVGDRTTTGRGVERRVRVPMPGEVFALSELDAADYLQRANESLGGVPMGISGRSYLLGKLLKQEAGVVGELHARAAFVVACTFLPLMGAGLGLMFKSGNFLTAFAVSMVPAAVCIAFIMLGQGIVEDIGKITEGDLADPSKLRPSNIGLSIIWVGNALVILAGSGLLWRLRQR